MSLKSVKIVLTFFFLWIATQFDIRTENYLAYFFILSFGMLHGSNDIKLVGSIQNIPNFNFWTVLIFYVGVVLLAFTVFMLFPKLGLLFFILISGYHFGEQHLEGKLILPKFMTFSFYTLYGLLILSMIFYTHYASVFEIVRDISGVSLSEKYYLYFVISLFAFLVLFTLLLAFREKRVILFNVFEEFAYLMLFYVLFMNSTLFWSFAIYFIVWHSIPSIRDQIRNLYDEVSFSTVFRYIKESYIYWIISVIGIILLTVFTKNDLQLFNQLFFALLAAITLPHVIILGKIPK